MKPAAVMVNADLTRLSTFALPARAHELVILDQTEQLPALSRQQERPLVLGGGSNSLFLSDYPGRILLNRLRGLRLETDSTGQLLIHVGAGENWHALVRHCLDKYWHGLENLAMIPGSVGAAPIQNIGAYGVELSDVLDHLLAWDWQEHRFQHFEAENCGLGYRDSLFKSGQPGRYLITEVCLRLSRQFEPVTRYASLADALERRGWRDPSARQLVATVMRLRRHRLPDPRRLANAGSFFKNPIVDRTTADQLLQRYPELPHWGLPDGQIKLAAGWMIESLGLRGQRINDAGIYHGHALVLVNHGQATASDLIALIDLICTRVEAEFGLSLEPEPRLIQGSLAWASGRSATHHSLREIAATRE